MTPEQQHSFIDKWEGYFEHLRHISLTDIEKEQLLGFILRSINETLSETQYDTTRETLHM